MIHMDSGREKRENSVSGKKQMKREWKKMIFSFGHLDLPFVIIVATLLIFGLVALYSSSYAYCYYRWEDSNHYIRNQLTFAFIGSVAMYMASRLDYHIFQRISWLLYFITLGFLVLVLFMPEFKGCRRWIVIPGFNFQPSEVAKFSIITIFASIISHNYQKMKSFLYGTLPFVTLLSPVVLLMLLEPHLSGTILIVGIAVSMMFTGGTSWRWFLIGVAIVVLCLVVAVVVFPDLVPYAASRIYNWQHPLENMSGENYQTVQGLYAIGSGGAMGLGLGNSRQKHMYVPEPYNDFIFSILCEELGFVGAMIVIFLFIALLVRGLYIAVKAKDIFGSMMVVGIVIQITTQAMLNIAVVTNTIPNTGISLPFFSYGGTSLMMLLAETGVVLSVSRQSKIEHA